ncbi:MAG TPA: HAD hydrolase-like protein [Verrucomicrobiae bacterium]
MVKLVLFDIDGTLIRSGGAGVRAFDATFTEIFGLKDAAKRMKFAGRTDVSLVREAFTLFGVECAEVNFQKFFEHYPKFLTELLKSCTGGVCEGIHSMIDELKRVPEKPMLGLLTGNIRRGAELKLMHYGLWHHFTTGAFADDHEDRNCIAGIARDRGSETLERKLRGEEIVVIGDTPLDILCGQSIGARVLAVGTGEYKKEELAKSNPTWAVDHVGQISVSELLGR